MSNETIKREDIRAMLHVAETPGTSVDVKQETLAELCRTWLVVQDAPRVGLFDSRSYGWSIDGDLPERFNGIDVRIVPDPTP